MRDEMSMGVGIQNKKELIKLEQKIFKYANALISVSKPILDEFETMCSNKKVLFREIRNGYDFDLIENKSKNKYFTITYTGNFYGHRNPISFLKALSNLFKKDSSLKIRVKFIGVKTHFDIQNNLSEVLEIIPSVAHKEVISIMKNSDLLLLIHPKNGRKGIFTGKLFEYLASLKTILALVDTDDVAAKLIKQTNAGFVCDNYDIDKIEDMIIEAYNNWTNDVQRVFDKNIIKKHHRKEQVKRLESLIEELNKT